MDFNTYLDNFLSKHKPKAILEIGFETGITSDIIQKHNPLLHVIVERNKDNYDNLLKWKKDKKTVMAFGEDINNFTHHLSVDVIVDTKDNMDNSYLHHHNYKHYVSQFILIKDKIIER